MAAVTAGALTCAARDPSSRQREPSSLDLSLFHDGLDDLVCTLGRCRQRQARYRKLVVPPRSPVVATGRFMVHFPDENLADGVAMHESEGFFDIDNAPPCDTWESLFLDPGPSPRHEQRALVCYVPAFAIDAADAGIDVNPESCIAWLDQSRTSIRQRFERW